MDAAATAGGIDEQKPEYGVAAPLVVPWCLDSDIPASEDEFNTAASTSCVLKDRETKLAVGRTIPLRWACDE